ncbi:MAG: hypothetical protein JOZ14_09625 [Acidobacteria bacterium]|nr:hypothetical protein [Acidobacteriota bacterium]
MTIPARVSTVKGFPPVFPATLRTSRTTTALLAITLGALFIHGYHPYVEDAEIYLPGVENALQPWLFPVGREFFGSHAHLTLFPNLIAASARLTHLPLEYALFGWHIGCIFLLLLASWQLTGQCFTRTSARWGAVGAMAALLTLPVAGTALYIMDQYLNPRNLAASAALFATTRVLEGKLTRAAFWLVLALTIHPLMGSFALVFSLLLAGLEWFEKQPAAQAWVFPFGRLLAPSTPAYHEAVRFHVSHYLVEWHWYEWLGIVAPPAIFWWIHRFARRQNRLNLARLCRALLIYSLGYFAAALVISLPPRFETLARIQPLRSFHLLYMLLVLVGGGLLAEYALRKRIWRWLALFLPLCAGMFSAQRALFPSSAHIEWPWAAPQNRWTQAFLWIRQNTPVAALFALDPFYSSIPGEDTVGFRAAAERSRLADAYKDSGVVSMFPELADQWWTQFQALKGWNQFERRDFLALEGRYGVSWVVLQAPGIAEFDCPYRNPTVMVCRLVP